MKHRRSRSRHDSGYVLLMLLLIMALGAIAAGIITSTLAWEIRRDREEEMIHRASQYRRAIRAFTKGKGRYPNTLDELMGASGLRYIRRRYMDPITGKDFRTLHAADIPTGIGSMSHLNGNPDSADPSAQTQTDNGTDTSQSNPAPEQTPQPTPGQPTLGQTALGQQPTLGQPIQGTLSGSSGQPFGGGPIVGVASYSKKKTIREFEHKNHYNQWLFFYDPGFERPYQIWGPTPSMRMPAGGILQGASNPQGNSQPQAQPQPPAAPQQ